MLDASGLRKPVKLMITVIIHFLLLDQLRGLSGDGSHPSSKLSFLDSLVSFSETALSLLPSISDLVVGGSSGWHSEKFLTMSCYNTPEAAWI
jgi:hypothetical protein